VQEVFLQAYEPFIRGEIVHPRTFLNRLVTFRAIDMLRKRRAFDPINSTLPQDESPNVETAASHREEESRLRLMVAELPPRQAPCFASYTSKNSVAMKSRQLWKSPAMPSRWLCIRLEQDCEKSSPSRKGYRTMSDHEHTDWEKEMPANFHTTLDGIRTESIPLNSLERSLMAAESIRMTPASWKRGCTNAAIGAVLMYSFVALVTFGFNKVLQWNVWTSVFGLLGIMLILAYVGMFVTWMIGRKAAGAVLLDCGPHPAKKLFLTIAVMVVWPSLLSLFNLQGAIRIISFAWTISVGCYWIFMSTGRLQIRENGIWQYWSLLRWEKVKSYHWKGKTDATLMVQAKTYFSFMGRGALPVANEQKEAVDDLLKKHVSATLN